MLCETRHQFDVVNTFCSWDAYKLLVLPDDVRLEGEVGERVRRHLDAGKPVLSSWRSGMDMAGSAFVFKEWGLDYLGECPYDPAYMEVAPQWAEGLPEMWMALYGKCLELKPHEGVETLAHVVAPYYNEGWDGEHGYCYTPPDKVTSSPAAVLAAQVGHFSWPLFEAYHQCAAPFHRELLAKCLARLFPDPLLKDDNLPSYARATVTAQPGRWMVHLMSYLPERRGQTMQIIEEPIVLRDVSFSLRLEGRSPRGVYLAPGKAALAYATDGDYLRITVPEVNGYAMAVVEF